MDRLPNDLLYEVFLRVPWKSRLRCRVVCRRWLGVLRGAAAWRDVPRTVRSRMGDAFAHACQERRLDIAQRLVNQFGDLPGARKPALLYACNSGHLEVARWLASTFELTAGDAGKALLYACGGGHLEVARWLASTFELTVHDARADNNYALRYVCVVGHLEIAQWLTSTFELTVHDARADNNFALRHTCGGGHLEVARWLTSTFGLSAADARAADDTALNLACVGSHLEVIRWIASTFGIAAEEYSDCIVDACQYDNITVAQLIVDMGDPASVNADHIWDVLVDRCIRGHLDTAKWIAANIPLPVGWEVSLLRRAGYHGQTNVDRWLIDMVGETAAAVAAAGAAAASSASDDES